MAGTPEELLRILADPERLAVAGALASQPRTVSDLAHVVRLPTHRVRRHLGRLAAAGIAEAGSDRKTYRLVAYTLRDAAREVGPDREPGLALGAVYKGEEAVLRDCFRQGRLREIPVKRSRRNVVLSRLALEFEVGVCYSEPDVNETLKRFHDDYASLRRYLVDEGFLSRERGEYWRSGRPVDV